MAVPFKAASGLAANITRTASSQAYNTIRFLADRDRTAEAYAAYAYFRWVDDWLDQEARPKADRVAFVDRQLALADACYRGVCPPDLLSEEEVLVGLIRASPDRNNGLAAYIYNMLAVMAFDADRRGRLISERELSAYQSALAIAVTEAMRYFIGHDQNSPRNEDRYSAVRAAHITHMLRDTVEDLEAGYYNIPAEYLNANSLGPQDVDEPAYKRWVCSRVEEARSYFKRGRQYIAGVANVRYRLACGAYMARFQILLDVIRSDGYMLRRSYRLPGRPGVVLRMAWSTLVPTLFWAQPPSEPSIYSSP